MKQNIHMKWQRWGLRKKEDYMRRYGNGFSYKFYHKIARSIKNSIKSGRFKKRNFPTDHIQINAWVILQIFKKCRYTCHYCGMTNETSMTKHNERLTIDRKDSNKGYSLENCVLACKKCNYLKGNVLNAHEMKKIAPIIWKAVARTINELNPKRFRVRGEIAIQIFEWNT